MSKIYMIDPHLTPAATKHGWWKWNEVCKNCLEKITEYTAILDWNKKHLLDRFPYYSLDYALWLSVPSTIISLEETF